MNFQCSEWRGGVQVEVAARRKRLRKEMWMKGTADLRG
jgi:hypothetical protein